MSNRRHQGKTNANFWKRPFHARKWGQPSELHDKFQYHQTPPPVYCCFCFLLIIKLLRCAFLQTCGIAPFIASYDEGDFGYIIKLVVTSIKWYTIMLCVYRTHSRSHHNFGRLEKTTKGPDLGKPMYQGNPPSSVHPSRLQALASLLGEKWSSFVIGMLITSGKTLHLSVATLYSSATLADSIDNHGRRNQPNRIHPEIHASNLLIK